METNQPSELENALPEGAREVPWPPSGRLIFGPWCLLGVWPAVFGIMEPDKKKKQRGQE